MHKVSIILPTYNGERYIAKAIESIICQSYENWELIIINDCSSDLTPQIVRDYAEKDARIKVFDNEHNLKLPASLNKGFNLSTGDYLTWTSDDNLFKEEAIERMVSILEQNKDIGFVFSKMDYIDEDGKNIGSTVNVDSADELYYRNIVGASFMYTREVYKAIGEYNTGKFLVEDYDYWLRIADKYRIMYIDEVLYLYRQHSGSLTETRNRQMLEAKVALYRETIAKRSVKKIILGYIYREIVIAEFATDQFKEMKKDARHMVDCGVGRSTLPAKVRISCVLGNKANIVIKNVYRKLIKT